MSLLSSQADQVLISLNPKAGRHDPVQRAESLRDTLEERGYAVRLSTDLSAVAEQANELSRAGRLRALVGVGGDGTAAELVNRTVPDCPITLLPAGTANLLAKEFHLPKHPKKLAEMIHVGSTVTLDAGRVRTLSDAKTPAAGRLFLVLVSAGIDAWIVRRVHERREESYRLGAKKGGHIGYLSYIKPIFQAIRSYPYPGMTIEIEGGKGRRAGSAEWTSFRTERAKWAFFCNIPRYGFGAAPVLDSHPNDRLLDHCFFRRGGMQPSIFAVLLALCGGAHRWLPGARLGTGSVFRLSAEGNVRVPFEADGDPVGFLPAEIETVPARVTLIVPDRYARRMLPKKKKAAATEESICPAG